MKLYSARYCPFAQRAWMALLHKGKAFEYVEGEKGVVGSTRIVEFID